MNNLDAYLSEIKKFPVLRAEEAHALIQRLPDQDAEKKLTEGYLLLAYKIAEKHTKILGDIDLIHLVKWANYGLFDAFQHHVALLKKVPNPAIHYLDYWNYLSDRPGDKGSESVSY